MWPSLYTYLLFYLAGLSLSGGMWVILLHHVRSFVAVCRFLSSVVSWFLELAVRGFSCPTCRPM